MERVLFVEPLTGYRVRLGFTDGSLREVDLERYLHGPVFEAIRSDPEVLAQLARQLPSPGPVVLECWLHEGPQDEDGEEELLAEGLKVLRAYQSDNSGWKSLDDFEVELTQE